MNNKKDMHIKNWNSKIKKNFCQAAKSYDRYSVVQKYFAKQILFLLRKILIPDGKCFELGAGTGQLADLIEEKYCGKNIIRIDISEEMLNQNKVGSKNILWDLNDELPSITENSALLLSSFCLHWLNNPEKRIKEWFNKLKKGGYLVIAAPTDESFPEWRKTCKVSDISYSGLQFPDWNKILIKFSFNQIVINEDFIYIENFPDIYKLFRNIIQVGAQSSKSPRNSIMNFRSMQKNWPKNSKQEVSITWKIKILILKKL